MLLNHKWSEINWPFFSRQTSSNSKVITEHLWFNNTKAFQAVDLEAGDVVEFDARVTPYEKGYQGYRQFIYKPITRDYKLSRPTKVKKVKEAKKS